MYDDYPIIYESTVNQLISIWIILGILGILLLIIVFISLAKVFKKANRSSLSAWIPFYNLYCLIEITNLPKYYFLLSLIPLINIFFIIKIIFKLAKSFKKSQLFSIGLTFLPFIFYPILGFGKSEYMGINLVAIEGKNTISVIPEIDLNKNKKIEIEINEKQEDESGVNISLGAGVYQNDFLNMESKNTQPKEKISIDNLIKPTQNINNNEKTDLNNNVDRKIENDLFNVDYINPNSNQINPNTDNKNITTINNDLNELNQQQENKINTSLEYKICPNCGAKVKQDSSTCFICGTSFN